MTYHVIPEQGEQERQATSINQADLALDEKYAIEEEAGRRAMALLDRGYFVRGWRDTDRYWHVQAIDLHIRSRVEEAGPRIQFWPGGESSMFVATRPVHNSEHHNATIDAGERVFFSRGADGLVVLAYANGEPTDGNQYVKFTSIEAASLFASRSGLVRV